MADNDHVVMVVGPERNHRSYFRFARAMDRILRRLAKADITIISGPGEGTAYLTFIYALRRGLRHVIYEPKRLDYEAAVYRMQERMLEEATHLVTVIGEYDKYVAQVGRIADSRNLSRRVITLKPEQEHGKEPKEGYRSYRELDKRTLSRYRKRRADAPFPGEDERPRVRSIHGRSS